MDNRTSIIGGLLAGVLLTTAIFGVSAMPQESIEFSVGDAESPTPSPTPGPATTVPQVVNESRPGAEALYQELHGDYANVRVFITETGGVQVVYQSDSSSGPELKKEMRGVAVVYADVMDEYPQTGGLTVTANGVQMLVSKDAAAAHGAGDIKEDAYFKTIHFKSLE